MMKNGRNIWRAIVNVAIASAIVGAVGFSAIACKTPVDPPAEAPKYSITIKDGGTNASASPNTAASGQTVSLNAGTRDGFVFDTWEVNKPTGLAISGNSFQMPASDVEVTAKWLAAITVTFDYGYDDKTGTTQVGQGRPMAVPAEPTRDGWAFDGWFTDEALTAKYDFQTPVTSAFTLYAKWATAWMVTFNYNYNDKIVKRAVRKDGHKVAQPIDIVNSLNK